VSDAEIAIAARKVLKANEGVTLASAKVVSTTSDSKGVTWVLLDVLDSKGNHAQAVITYDGKKWDEAVYGQSVSTGDLPPDVKF
jgi:hypothetical protein